MKKLHLYFSIFFIFLFISGFTVHTVFSAETIEEIEEKKSKKEAELNRINKDINKIASSKASISSKLSLMKAEKKKLQELIKSMDKDVVELEKENISQENKLVELAKKYSLQQALFYVESQKSVFVTIFESPDLSQLLDRMLYHKIQTKLITERENYILLKKTGIDNRKVLIAKEKKLMQDSISSVNQQIATLEEEKTRLAIRLAQNYSMKGALSADISNLSKAAQAILDAKASGTDPTGGEVGGGGGSGSGGGGNPPPVPTPNPSGAITVLVGGEVIQRTNNPVKVSSSSNEMVLRGARTGEFTGTLLFDKRTGIYAINVLSMDQYLWGLAEMPSSWPANALKVQAIAGRSYAAYKMAAGGYGRFDIYDSVRDQEFVGLGKIKSSYGSQWKNAVNETSNKVLKYNGVLVQAFYSAEAGGHTIASTESPSFGGYRAYLQPKPDRYLDNGVWKPYGNSSVSYWKAGTKINTMALMKDYLNGAIYYELHHTVKAPSEQSATTLKNLLGTNSIQSKVGNIESIQHIYDKGDTTIIESTKYTKSVRVVGDAGEYTLTAKAFKSSYNVRSPGRNALWSMLYDIKKVSNNNWEMWSRSWGHRVGMSQYGAYGRAQAGQGYEEILSYYYNGANVVQYSVGRNIKVALAKYGSSVMRVSSNGESTLYDGNTELRKVPAGVEIKIEYN